MVSNAFIDDFISILYRYYRYYRCCSTVSLCVHASDRLVECGVGDLGASSLARTLHSASLLRELNLLLGVGVGRWLSL